MANAIPDLWPDEIAELDVLTPVAILRVQAGQLRQKTRGLVEADVVTETRADSVHYYFDLIAPALGRYRYRLLDAWHLPMRVYPVSLWTDQWDDSDQEPRVCATQGELVEALGQVFRSSDTRAVISSFIAQSNEQGSGAPGARE